jgi:alanine racemase
MESSICTSWLEIDLGAIQNNIHLLQKMTGKQVMAIVKANAYGHGMPEVVKTAFGAGVTWFGVARVEEAIQVLEAAPNARVLVMGYTPPDMVAEAVKRNITLAVYDVDTAAMYSEKAGKAGGSAKIHLKFDTGMGRLGFHLQGCVDFARKVMEFPHLTLEGVFTHFARADEPDVDTTSDQIVRFNQILSDLRKSGIQPSLVHASNSAGTLNYPDARFNLVRTGISIYGMDPSPSTPLPADFQPALAFKSRLTSVKMLPAGHGISYGHYYFTPKEERIGVVGVGYADGFRRTFGGHALIHGKKAPVLGAVCMDQCMVLLDEIPEAKIGDEVVLIGSQGKQRIRAEELAKEWGTIPYEVVCGMSARLPRIYIQ